MLNSPQGSWPTADDRDRIWDSTQKTIGKKQHAAKVRKIGIIAGAGTIVLGVTGAAIIIPATQYQIDNTTRCYSAQSTTSEYGDMAQVDGMDPLGVAGAINGCEALWSYGYMVPGKFVGAGDTNHGPTTTSPSLGACLNPNNTVVVFPLDDGQGNILSQTQLCKKVSLRVAAS